MSTVTSFEAFCQRFFPAVFHQPFGADQLAVTHAVEGLLAGVTPAVASFSLDRGRGVTSLILAGAMYASFEWRLPCVTVLVDSAEQLGPEILFGFQRYWEVTEPHWGFWYSRPEKAWLFGWRHGTNATDRLIHVTARRQAHYLLARSTGRIRRPQLVLMDNINPQRAAIFAKRLARDGSSVLILNNHETRPEASRDVAPPPGHGMIRRRRGRQSAHSAGSRRRVFLTRCRRWMVATALKGFRTMLVLSRRKKEKVVITVPGYAHNPIVIEVVALPQGRVRIGFDANPEVIVDRGEVYGRKIIHGLIADQLREEAELAQRETPVEVCT